jgi:hypothetical protein
VVPASQVIVTSRAAFVLTTIGAWIGGSLSFVFVIWAEELWVEAVSNSIWAAAWIVPLAMLGATVGAMIAMFCGCSLSRQFCWLFCVVAGMLVVPLGAMITFRISQLFPNAFSLIGGRMRGPSILIPLLGSILGGIVLGVLLTATRTGFGPRARRIGAIAGLAAGALYSLTEFAMYWLEESMKPRGAFYIEWPWQAMLTFGGFTVVATIAIAAAWCAQRPMGRSYEVLPITGQTKSTAGPGAPDGHRGLANGDTPRTVDSRDA